MKSQEGTEMDGIMPMSFQFTDADARTMGQQMQTGLTPFLTQMNEIMRRRSDELSRIGFGVMTMVIGAMSTIRGLQQGIPTVQVLNLDFLELMAAGSFAFIVLIFLKLYDLSRQMASVHVQLNLIERNIAAMLASLTALQLCVCGLLASILAELRAGLLIRGRLSIVIDLGASFTGIDFGKLALQMALAAAAAVLLTGALALLTPAIVGLAIAFALLAGAIALLGLALRVLPENLPEIVDALILLGIGLIVLGAAIAVVATRGKLLAQIALGFFIIFAFLLGLALALRAMPENLQDIVTNLGKLGIGILVLGAALALLKPEQFKQVALGFLAIGGFLLLVGLALRLFNAETLKAIPSLNELFEGLIKLGNAIKGFSEADLKKIGLSFLGIAAFIFLLGLALRLFNADVLNALPGLDSLFTSLANLAKTIVSFTKDQMIQIAAGLAGIVVFLGLLGLVLRLFNADVLNALPGLGQLFENLINLARAIAAFTVEQMWQIGAGFLGIVVFLGLLSFAVNNFNVDVLNALPALGQLFENLINLANTIAAFSVDQMWQIAAGLLGIVVFLGLLSFAVNNFNVDVLNALPALGGLFDSLINLANAIVGFSPGQLLLIGAAMAGLTAFMFGLALALDLAVPGLNALAGVLARLESLFSSVAGAAGRALSAISAVPNFGGMGGLSLPSFQEGGLMPHTGLAFLHEGERVLNPAQASALEGTRGGPAFPIPAAAQTTDQSVNIQGGITVNISVEHMDPAAAPQISDEIVRHLQDRLASLRTEQSFRTGTRTAAPT